MIHVLNNLKGQDRQKPLKIIVFILKDLSLSTPPIAETIGIGYE